MITLNEKPLDDTVQDFFDKAEECGLERREGQLEMALEISDAILHKYPLAAEAGVGIGKSFAYLVPLVLSYFRERRQIIISTSTIALQEQLERDIHTVFKMLGVKAEVIVATGMKNYVCCRKLKNLIRHDPNNTMLLSIWDKVSKGCETRKDMQMLVPDEVWDHVKICNYGERCSTCQSKFNCKYYEMRSKLRNSNCFIICNQNMLVAHLTSRNKGGAGIFNNNVRTIVIDEAHNIESKFRDAYTISMSKSQMVNELKEAMKKLKNKSIVADTIIKLNAVFHYLNGDVRCQQKETDMDMQAFFYNETAEIRDMLFWSRRNMVRIEELTGCRLYCLSFLRKLCNVGKKNLIWLDNSNVIRICICTKDIRSDISGMLFKNGVCTILTSATLSSGGKEGYDYFLNSIGYPSNAVISESKRSPFDYDNNTMLYTTSALPYPSIDGRDEYRRQSITEIVELLNVTHGRTLILFTAKADMEFVYKKLSNMGLPYKFIMQGTGSSQKYLLDKFRNDKDSVFLGMGTLWEGINVEGEALSQVIIFKLPFPFPDPIEEYKMSLVKDPVNDVAVPEMIIKLKQGAGRLIRSATDKGIISVLDPRISESSTSSYKGKTLASLPVRKRTENIDKLKDFWKNLNDKENR